jgi:hypothetical protein
LHTIHTGTELEIHVPVVPVKKVGKETVRKRERMDRLDAELF